MRPSELREIIECILPSEEFPNHDAPHLDGHERRYPSLELPGNGNADSAVRCDDSAATRALWALVGHARLLLKLYEDCERMDRDNEGVPSGYYELLELDDQPCMHGGSCEGRIIGNRKDV
jgi:hypothetical protein